MPRKSRRLRRYPAQAIFDKYRGLDNHEIAYKFGVGFDTVSHWRTRKMMFSEWTADELAIKAGVHPSYIWPEWFDIPLTVDTWRHKDTKVGV